MGCEICKNLLKNYSQMGEVLEALVCSERKQKNGGGRGTGSYLRRYTDIFKYRK